LEWQEVLGSGDDIDVVFSSSIDGWIDGLID